MKRLVVDGALRMAAAGGEPPAVSRQECGSLVSTNTLFLRSCMHNCFWLGSEHFLNLHSGCFFFGGGGGVLEVVILLNCPTLFNSIRVFLRSVKKETGCSIVE